MKTVRGGKNQTPPGMEPDVLVQIYAQSFNETTGCPRVDPSQLQHP